MASDRFWAACLFAVTMAATPGPNNMILLASGLSYGFRRTLPGIFGVTLGFASIFLMAGLGAGQLFERFPTLYVVLKWASAAYIVWLASRIATATGAGSAKARSEPISFVECAALQLVNPKGWAVALGAVTAYADPANYGRSLAILFAIFCGITPIVSVGWTLFGSALSHYLADARRRRMFNVAMAAALIASLVPVLLGR